MSAKRTSRIDHKTGESPIQPEGIPSSPLAEIMQDKDSQLSARVSAAMAILKKTFA